jgi:fusaric acid resistance family protein
LIRAFRVKRFIEVSRTSGGNMQDLYSHRRTLTGIARGVRAAIVLPPLFAISLITIGQPVMAGYAVFGTFAHLVMVDYSTAKNERLKEAGVLTALGGVLVILGTAASTNLWLAVLGAFGAVLLLQLPINWPAFHRERASVLRPALILSFMLAVSAPTPIQSLPLELGGWLLAGLVAQVALRWLWLPMRSVDPTTLSDMRLPFLAHAATIALSMGLAVLIVRVVKLEHAFWVVLGVAPMLTISSASVGYTFRRQIAGTFLGFLLGGLLITGVGPHIWAYWIILPVTIFLAAYLSSAGGFTAGQAGFTMFAVVLFCILTPLQGHVGMVRLEDIAIGGAVSLVIGCAQNFSSNLRVHAQGASGTTAHAPPPEK